MLTIAINLFLKRKISTNMYTYTLHYTKCDFHIYIYMYLTPLVLYAKNRDHHTCILRHVADHASIFRLTNDDHG